MPRKSNFITDSEVPDGHFFDTFGNGVNRKISKENLFAQIQEQAQTYYYDSEDDLKAADLEADPDNPIYVRVAPSWRLYRITSLAPIAPFDIPLNNGATATLDRLENLQFVNVQDMEDCTYLKLGDIVHTAGYFSPGDGGANSYEIVAAGTGIDDGGSFIDLSGGLQAKGLFPNGYQDPRQYGISSEFISSTWDGIKLLASFFGAPEVERPVLTSGTQQELTAALGSTSGLGLVDDSAAAAWVPVVTTPEVVDSNNSNSYAPVNPQRTVTYLIDTLTDGAQTTHMQPDDWEPGDVVRFVDYESNFGTASFTIDFETHNFEGTGSATLVMSVDDGAITLEYIDATRGFQRISVV